MQKSREAYAAGKLITELLFRWRTDMKHNVLALLLCLSLISACGPSPEAMAAQTATAATAIAASWTKTPTPTITPTSTPTATFTPSPTPTPFGGGSGRLLFFRDSALSSFDIVNQNVEVILSKQSLMEVLELENVFHYGISGYISPDGKKALIHACGDESCTDSKFKIALVTTTLSLVKSFNLGSISAVQWSPDSQKFLIQLYPGGAVSDGFITHIIDSNEANFGERIRLERAFHAFFSSDGRQVYYSTLGGYKVVNSNGSDKRALNCEVCKDSFSYAGAVSPDGLKVVVPLISETETIQIVYPDVTVTDSKFKYSIVIANGDFSASQVVASDIVSLSSISTPILWSADSERILFNVAEYDSDSQTIKSEEVREVIKVVEIDSGKISTLTLPEEAQHVFLCGWSPDNRLISYIAVFFPSGRFQRANFLQDLEGGEPARLTSFESGVESCPFWLSAEQGK